MKNFFRRKAKTSSEESQLFRSTGDSLLEQGKYNDAVVMYDRAILAAPQDPSLRASRSVAHTLSHPRQLDLALADAESATQLDPTHFRGWLQQGRIRSLQGHTSIAVSCYEKAVQYGKGEERTFAMSSLQEARDRLQRDPPDYSNRPGPTDPEASLRTPAFKLPERPQNPAHPPLNAPTGLSPTASSPPAVPQTTPPPPNPSSAPQSTASTITTSQVPQAPASLQPPQSPPRIPTPAARTTNENVTSSFDAPPTYTPHILSSDPNIRALSQQELANRIVALQVAIGSKSKGGISLRTQTLGGSVDAVQLIYSGITSNQLTTRELPTPFFVHNSLRTYKSVRC